MRARDRVVVVRGRRRLYKSWMYETEHPPSGFMPPWIVRSDCIASLTPLWT